jgi:hypothetical protein
VGVVAELAHGLPVSDVAQTMRDDEPS